MNTSAWLLAAMHVFPSSDMSTACMDAFYQNEEEVVEVGLELLPLSSFGEEEYESGTISLIHRDDPRSHTLTDPFWSPDIISDRVGCRATEFTGDLQSRVQEENEGLRKSHIFTVPLTNYIRCTRILKPFN